MQTPNLNSHQQKLTKLILIFITLVSGAAVMVIEMAANRILSPWFGNGLYTWTALIGVILISMSLGSYLGGFWADRKPHLQFLGHILLAAGITTLIIPLMQKPLEGLFDRAHLIWGPVAASLLLFALPAIILGHVTPFVIRLSSIIHQDSAIGFSAGMMGMFSTLGSVLGTFATGLFLIPHFNVHTIFISVAVALSLLAILAYWFFRQGQNQSQNQQKNPSQSLKSFLLLFLVPSLMTCIGYFHMKRISAEPNMVLEKNTFYHRIRVYAYPMQNGDTLKSLTLDTTSEGAQFEISREIPIEYQKYWELIKAWKPQLRSAAFLGGGAFAMPLAVKEFFPQSTIDVAEIDPEVIEVGKKFFRMSEANAPTATAGDARRFLKMADKKYEFIFSDTYNGIRYIPAHLITKEFFELVKEQLDSEGVYMLNLISSLQGEKSKLFQSVVKTLQLVFPHIYVYAIDPDRLNTAQNIIIADSPKSPLNVEAQPWFEKLVSKDSYNLENGDILTDSYNPIESIVANALLEEAQE